MRIQKYVITWLGMFFLLGLEFLVAAEEIHLQPTYTLGSWNAEKYGNHRAVIYVEKPADAVRVRIPWRRRDFHPEKKQVTLVDAATGIEINNILRININRELGDLIFQPQTVPGKYYAYYLVNVMSGRSNYPTVVYPEPQFTADPRWLEKHRLQPDQVAGQPLPDLPQARVIEFQAIDKLNSFFPMEVIATAAEHARLLKKYPHAAYLIFPEDRMYPIRMSDDLPLRWIQQGIQTVFSGQAARGEYYAFQLGIYACRNRIDDMEVEFSSLKSLPSGTSIPKSELTCFNTEGMDWKGRAFKKNCAVPKGKIQAIWCGVQIPLDILPGKYQGVIKVTPKNLPSSQIKLEIEVTNHVLKDKGDSEPWRHSRLRWLNSLMAFDDEIVSPYIPLSVQANTVTCLGRTVTLQRGGFPASIQSFFLPEMTSLGTVGREILADPIELNIVPEFDSRPTKIVTWKKSEVEFLRKAPGAVSWKASSTSKTFRMECQGQMEFDGFIDFKVKLEVTTPSQVKDIRLEIPIRKSVAQYMMGMGVKGGYRPSAFQWQWEQKNNQDSVWIGDVNAGMQCSFRDENYSRPLNTNFYLRKPLVMPRSWWNDGKGGCELKEVDEETCLLTIFSGAREINPGDDLYFNFSLLITPFRPLNTRQQWQTRFYHRFDPLKKIIATGANTINVHHATEINPFINYPFLRPQAMKKYIDAAHARNLKVKIYYTVRELTNRAPEIFALRSLGDEIFFPGKGGGFSWLQEHLGSNYIAAWFVPRLKDAAIINSGVSRWHNYYVEGLNWLTKNVGIDGLYIDDVAFDRTTMKRVKKVLEWNRKGALIDLHSANQFNVRDGFANSANLYLEHFPYIDRLWFGEYFDYDAPPDFWMVEMSGIPFGLMGEMLQDGGNPWRGMIYGMTSRLPWAGDPRPLWKIWDTFGLEDSSMKGYWAPDCPVQTNEEQVLATVFLRDQTAMIALASWCEKPKSIRLSFAWDRLGLSPQEAVLYAPFIENFQTENTFNPDDFISIEPGKGWLMILKSKSKIKNKTVSRGKSEKKEKAS